MHGGSNSAVSDGHFSAICHPIHFMFGSRVGFMGLAYRVLLFELNPTCGCRPSWKISNECVSGMGYPIHFHETESSFAGIWTTIMHEE